MASTETNNNEKQGVHLWQANVMCVVGFLVMLCASHIIGQIGKPARVKPEVPFWLWRNICISFLHASIVGVWDFLCIVWYPDLFVDRIEYINNFIYLMTPFSIGYFIYDLYDMNRNGIILSDWQMTIHHSFLFVAMSYNWTVQTAIPYCVIVMMAEINTIFLHMRRLLQFLNFGFESMLYRVVSKVNLSTFILCRIIPQLYTFVAFNMERHRVASPQYWLLTLTFPIGILINFDLFWKIIKADVLRLRKETKLQ